MAGSSTPWLTKYEAADVYNLDEAALFYKMLMKTFALKEADIKRREQNKDRVTVLFGASMCRQDELPLLVVGQDGKASLFENCTSATQGQPYLQTQ